MSDNLFFQTQYKLDKAYYTECFEQSSQQEQGWQKYRKAMMLSGIGAILILLTDILPYAAWFLFILGVVEALSVKYKKPWWITRQMWSQAANNTVHLTVDHRGFTTTLTGVKQHTAWQDINNIKMTEKGWVLETDKGKQYLSSQSLSPEVSTVLAEKAK
ncbi:YcxB family protein [Thalassotalea sp. 1_MG-2023]|uniref:YcxB family protein n=1 Tax=Thalassotalea sp. 1_MG-2023 TaxID=3062680 RepID=UPI0026E37F36|nr:YcxB family protein [Thalassotalea sp. 1_MG-2023]MDO6427168.1 YcxB family protein [Thalassotalea sp. 1_MG-2023]